MRMKRFNESSNTIDISNVIEKIEDMFVEMEDLNCKVEISPMKRYLATNPGQIIGEIEFLRINILSKYNILISTSDLTSDDFDNMIAFTQNISKVYQSLKLIFKKMKYYNLHVSFFKNDDQYVSVNNENYGHEKSITFIIDYDNNLKNFGR